MDGKERLTMARDPNLTHSHMPGFGLTVGSRGLTEGTEVRRSGGINKIITLYLERLESLFNSLIL